MAISLDQQLDWMRAGSERFESVVAGVSDEDLVAPSGLPDWSRAHVVVHVARNADAMVNLLTWARTGVETPMYPSREVRDAEIQTGVRRSPAEVREDLLAAHRRLTGTIAELPPECWSAQVRNFQGKPMLASHVPWMRGRELWVHGIDLDAGAAFADIPAPLLVTYVADAAAWMSARDGVPHVRLEPTDSEERWELGGSDGAPAPVSGTLADLAAYLLGRQIRGELRTADEPGTPPPLPRWL